MFSSNLHQIHTSNNICLPHHARYNICVSFESPSSAQLELNSQHSEVIRMQIHRIPVPDRMSADSVKNGVCYNENLMDYNKLAQS